MSFSAVVGHRLVVDLLQQAVRRGRVPQSLLFAGPDGVGKRVVATALAQAVNCPKAKDGDGCGRCPICLRIARHQHSDVTWLEKGDEASIKIDPLRERVLEAVGYRPFEGARRVFIIDPADELTGQAQDALLKTLEEPPPSAILILITAYPDTLAATIQSRCRRLRFGLLSERDVAEILVTRANLDPGVARRLAAVSGGSVARALSEELGHYDKDRDAVLVLLRAAAGTAMGDRLKASTALVQHGTKRRDRDALSARLAILSSLVRDLSAMWAAPDAALANTDLEDTIRPLQPRFQPARLVEIFGAIHSAASALDRYASPKIVADWLAVTI